MGQLKGKIALITGGNRGIGKGIAAGLAAQGAGLVLSARNGPDLEAAADQFRRTGTEVLAVPADITRESEVQELFRRTLQRFGRLDLLVNNAGAFDGGPLDELSVEAWDHVLAVNLRGPFLCTREALRIMKRQGGGRILNIGSISAQRVRPYSGPYSASKHGLWGLTQVTALEGRDFGIACSCLHPGNVRVERRRDSTSEIDQEPMMEVEELVRAAVTMLTLPPHVNMLEAVVLPLQQAYIGRG